MRRRFRAASPAGLILAGLCLLLPFLSASCTAPEPPHAQWRLTYTGVDVLTGGRPSVAFTEDADREAIRRLDDAGTERALGKPPEPLPPQPVAWLAVALMAAALAATALPSRAWRTTATGGLAVAAAVVLSGATVLARRDATDAAAVILSGVVSPPLSGPSVQARSWEHYGQVSDLFRYEYGFWVAVAALTLVGVANTVAAVFPAPGVPRDPATAGPDASSGHQGA